VTRAQIEARLAAIGADIDALYWTFTRTLRGRPPCIVRPELYSERRELLAELARRRKWKRKRKRSR
jgi:hypothetical protein